MIITGSINVSKIDKSKLIQGEKGTYLNIAIFLKDEEDQYGNHGMIVQGITKKEREAGNKGTILGNVKKTGQQQKAENNGEGLPF